MIETDPIVMDEVIQLLKEKDENERREAMKARLRSSVRRH